MILEVVQVEFPGSLGRVVKAIDSELVFDADLVGKQLNAGA